MSDGFTKELVAALIESNQLGIGEKSCRLRNDLDGKTLSDFRRVLNKIINKLLKKNLRDEIIYNAVLKLTASEKIVVVLSVIYSVKEPDIAAMLGISNEAVYTYKYRGLHTLSELLKNKRNYS